VEILPAIKKDPVDMVIDSKCSKAFSGEPGILLTRLVVFLSLLASFRICSHDFSCDWSAMRAGGGVCTAGVYVITGTIGQTDAGRLHSADFTLDGGFWSIIAAIQEPGAPLLSVRISETNAVIVSWPIVWTGFELMENVDVTTPNWVKVASSPLVVVVAENTVEKHVVLPLPAGKRFYRLRKL
jgi:hypothetical protein